MAGESWSEWPFEAVIDFQEGPGIMARDFREAGIPLVRLAGLDRGGSVLDGCNYLDPKTVETRWAHFALQQGDILLSTSASLGRIAVVGHDAVGAIAYTGIIRMRPRDKRLRAQFIRYLLEGPEFQHQAEMVGVGSVIRHFGPMHLRQMRVRLPPPPEQRAIAQILGTLDDKIELNRRMNETLEEMARALFKSWFVDFDPVRRKAEGRDPGLPKHLADLFPSRFVDSELGEIPEGWPVATLKDVCEATKGVSYKGSGLADAGMPLHNLNSVYEGGGYKHEGLKHYTGEFADRHVVLPGDLLVANTEQGHDRLLIGYAAIVPSIYGDRGIASHHIYRVRPLAGTGLSAVYLCQLLNSRKMHELVSGYANGTTVNMLPVTALQHPMIVVPPSDLLRSFSDAATAMGRRREQTITESASLAAARDALLPKLISGELRVKEADRFLAKVTA
jgi:type I restriction enzyme S subunit